MLIIEIEDESMKWLHFFSSLLKKDSPDADCPFFIV